MNKDILICGVGGQGTVLASKIIAASAMEEGNTVHSAETIGMAQRGGSVTSHVRIGGNACAPLIPFGSADIILAFEPGEAVRNLRYLKKGGIVVVNTAATKPVTESLHDTGYDGKEMVGYLQSKCGCYCIDAEEVCKPFGSTKFFNVIILGVAAGSGQLGIAKETLLKQLELRVPPKYLEVNTKAFLAGVEIATLSN
ncbi:MAG: indolepyruvate oxidoreductase subunit beta [Lachnospiraceae bacterium]|nr:indolepyruvate oxidoreductase subunit beta [Lachnospiraceae bacterium]